MNENIDLTKILKDCPKGFELYSPIYGTVLFIKIKEGACITYPVKCKNSGGCFVDFTKEGYCFFIYPDAECLLFPSKDQRDWSKFTAPWLKKERFDPKTLKPFDKVLGRDDEYGKWSCAVFSHIDNKNTAFPYMCIENFKYCIPYNDETKHLVGTKEEAPEFYKYWED